MEKLGFKPLENGIVMKVGQLRSMVEPFERLEPHLSGNTRGKPGVGD